MRLKQEWGLVVTIADAIFAAALILRVPLLWIVIFSITILMNIYVHLRIKKNDRWSILIWISFSIGTLLLTAFMLPGSSISRETVAKMLFKTIFVIAAIIVMGCVYQQIAAEQELANPLPLSAERNSIHWTRKGKVLQRQHEFDETTENERGNAVVEMEPEPIPQSTTSHIV